MLFDTRCTVPAKMGREWSLKLVCLLTTPSFARAFSTKEDGRAIGQVDSHPSSHRRRSFQTYPGYLLEPTANPAETKFWRVLLGITGDIEAYCCHWKSLAVRCPSKKLTIYSSCLPRLCAYKAQHTNK